MKRKVWPELQSRRPRVSSFAAAAVPAVALSGCGGGSVSTGAPDGDDSAISLLDSWQRFRDGTPTLRMTNAQVSEAWRSAAGKSTHRVVLAEPVGVGSDPASSTPVETYPALPVDADACSPGECDIDPPPDGTWAFAPVLELEHNGVPLAHPQRHPGTWRGDMIRRDLRLEDGLFGAVVWRDGGERYDYLVGMFTGSGHREVGGEFRRDGIAGAFGARRR